MSGKALLPADLKDKSIREAYAEASDSGKSTKELGPSAVAKIIRAALDSKVVTKKEKADLALILNQAKITDKARQKLAEFEARTIKHLKDDAVGKVAEVIGNPANAEHIRFKFGPNTYRPTDYTYIARLIRDGDIDVYSYAYKEDTEVSQTYGLYNSAFDELFVADRSGSRTEEQRRSTMIHEATHAIQDKQNASILVRTAEAAAHIAQAVMLLTVAKGDDGLLYGRLKKPGIRDAALRVLDGEDLDKADRDAARKVIDKSKAYGAKAKQVTGASSEWYSFFEKLAYMMNS